MKKIVYELNEVPKKLFDFYADMFPDSAFAKLKFNSSLFETFTADAGHLSPWISWPTMHRGISNIEHEISDLGQDLTQVNKEFPSIFNYLVNNDVRVGVFGSLQSYPLPENLENYTFYIPDTFAAGSECFPKQLTDFQAFNLSMVRSSGRNVTQGIAVKEAGKFLFNARKLGLSWSTVGKLSKQIIQERFNKDRVVRRRTSQVEIAFDLYFKQLVETKPDISFFFTNHVASSMHRYWPAVFPNDYSEGKFDENWRKRWKSEIPHAVKVANFQLNKLLQFCDKFDFELIVCSSMGQDAVEDVTPISKQVLITNVRSLLRYLNVPDKDWEPRLSMAPRVVIRILSGANLPNLANLDKILVNGKRINHYKTSSGDIRFDIHLTDIDELYVEDSGKKISPKEIGIENINLQDASGSYAYHIPQGIMLYYKPDKAKAGKRFGEWKAVSVLDFCPSLISNFGGQVPNYMKGDRTLFQN